MTPEPILITGCARSGTSMTAGVVHLCGAWGGTMVGPNPFNPKGMFENKGFKRRALKSFLREIGVDPLGQNPLPDIKLVQRRAEAGAGEEFRSRVLSELKGQGYSGGPWFWKGAKLCLVWPVVHAAFPEAKWILVRRDPTAIADSCLRTAFMRAYDTREGWLIWVAQHEARFSEMKRAGLSIVEVWPEMAVLGDLSELESALKWVGLGWDDDRVSAFISRKLFHASDGTVG